MFKPYLTLDHVYVSPLKPLGNGLYTLMNDYEILSSIRPATESRLMDELMRTLCTLNDFSSSTVANRMGVNEKELNVCVHVHFGCNLIKLLRDYRHRLLFELIIKTSLTPAEVAQRTGFASVNCLNNYFNRVEKVRFKDVRASHQKCTSEVNATYQIR
ncbi:MAG: AraC family transcriptional regulator [Bacteroidales bacterium]|nr:AraC family transcriptional regulator [Candidatus Liminaster caballi]